MDNSGISHHSFLFPFPTTAIGFLCVGSLLNRLIICRHYKCLSRKRWEYLNWAYVTWVLAVDGTTHSPGPDLTSPPKHRFIPAWSYRGKCSFPTPHVLPTQCCCLESVLHVHLKSFVCLGGGQRVSRAGAQTGSESLCQLPTVLLFCRGTLGSPCPPRSDPNTSQFLLWQANQRSNRYSPCFTSSGTHWICSQFRRSVKCVH